MLVHFSLALYINIMSGDPSLELHNHEVVDDCQFSGLILNLSVSNTHKSVSNADLPRTG